MEASIDATSISDRRTMSHLGYMVGRPAEMWEWFAGSGRLSAAARASGVSHLPPLDYRWGVDLGEISTQIRVLWTFLVYGCEVLFAAPACTPWGANARGWPSDKRTAQRTHQRPALQFLAAVCVLQQLLGRTYIIENPKGSDSWRDSLSPLSHLVNPTSTGAGVFTNLDQCAFGAQIQDRPIKKSTELLSNHSLPNLCCHCPGDHDHLHLRGSDSNGSLTAQAAVYPSGLCSAVLGTVGQAAAQRTGGRIQIDPIQLQFKNLVDDRLQILSVLLAELRVHAMQQNKLDMWNRIVEPWLATAPQLSPQSLAADSVLHLTVRQNQISRGPRQRDGSAPPGAKPSADVDNPVESVASSLRLIQAELRQLRVAAGLVPDPRSTSTGSASSSPHPLAAAQPTDEPTVDSDCALPDVTDLVTGQLKGVDEQ